VKLAFAKNFSLATMSERERRLVMFGGAAAVVLVLLAVVLPLDRSVARAHDRVTQKQSDLLWMRSIAPELGAAGPVAARPDSAESLLVTIDRSAREAGLGSALTSSEPSGAGALSIRLEKASFDQIVGWLARLAEQNGVRVDAATIDAAGEPGLVNASLVLRIR
jgi:type II secretory pathway component PulM